MVRGLALPLLPHLYFISSSTANATEGLCVPSGLMGTQRAPGKRCIPLKIEAPTEGVKGGQGWRGQVGFPSASNHEKSGLEAV